MVIIQQLPIGQHKPPPLVCHIHLHVHVTLTQPLSLSFSLSPFLSLSLPFSPFLSLSLSLLHTPLLASGAIRIGFPVRNDALRPSPKHSLIQQQLRMFIRSRESKREREREGRGKESVCVRVYHEGAISGGRSSFSVRFSGCAHASSPPQHIPHTTQTQTETEKNTLFLFIEKIGRVPTRLFSLSLSLSLSSSSSF